MSNIKQSFMGQDLYWWETLTAGKECGFIGYYGEDDSDDQVPYFLKNRTYHSSSNSRTRLGEIDGRKMREKMSRFRSFLRTRRKSVLTWRWLPRTLTR